MIIVIEEETRRRHKIKNIMALKKSNGFMINTKGGSVRFADNKHLAEKIVHHLPHLKYLFTLGVLDASELIGRYIYGRSTLLSSQDITHKILT